MKKYINCCASIVLAVILTGCDANDAKSIPANEPVRKEALKKDKGTKKATENVVAEVKSKEVPATKEETVLETPATQKETVETEEPVVKEEVEEEIPSSEEEGSSTEETSDQSTNTSTPQVEENIEKIPANVEHIQQENDAIKTNVENDDSGCQVYNPITGGCED